MAKNSNNPVIIIGAIVFLLVVGVLVTYVIKKNEQTNQTSAPQQKHCTTYNGTIEEQCTEDYVGLQIKEATDRAKANGLFPKTLKRDGKTQGFNDVGGASIYFEIENDIVTKAYFDDNRPK